jgi:hypothetical protein
MSFLSYGRIYPFDEGPIPQDRTPSSKECGSGTAQKAREH